MLNLVEYLKNKITNETSLSGIVDVFEEMCQIPLDEDWLLFETGIYTFTGEPQFYFSLVRQFPHEDEENDEYYQLHLNVLFPPAHNNKKYNEATWNMDIEGSFFEYIRESAVYNDIKNDKYSSIEIYMDET